MPTDTANCELILRTDTANCELILRTANSQSNLVAAKGCVTPFAPSRFYLKNDLKWGRLAGMVHRIYTGSFAALEGKWLEEVSALQSGDPLAPVVTLVGSNLLASHLKRVISRRTRGAANLRFPTFLDLATSLAQPLPEKPRLPHLGASAILESLLLSGTPDIFLPVASFPGFRAALLDTFRDLRDSGVSLREFNEGIRRCIAAAPERKEHLEGLADIFRRFRGKLATFHGVDENFRLAAANAGGASERLGSGRLLVYGIYDATGQQSVLLDALGKSMELSCFIPFLDDSVSSFAGRFLQARAGALGVRAESLAEPAAHGALGELRSLNFGFKPTPGGKPASGVDPSDGSFAIVSAPGESRVAVEVVREILCAVRDGVISGFQEAAVVLRQPETEVPILTEALRLRGIPHHVDGGSSFDRRPLARAVMALAALEGDGFSRQSILTAMEWISAAPSPAFEDRIPEWNALTADPRFLAGIEAWDAGTDVLVREAAGALARAKDNAGKPGGDPDDPDLRPPLTVAEAERRLAAARRLERGWKAVREAAAGWPVSLSWREWSEFLRGRLEPLLKDSPDWHRLASVLAEIGSLSDAAAVAGIEDRVSRTRMTASLQESLSSATYPDGFQPITNREALKDREDENPSSLRGLSGDFLKRRAGVNILSAGAARGLRFPLVILPGLEEGRFPVRLRQDPLLLDAERLRIGPPGRLPLKSGRRDEEKLLFDMIARSAEKRLVLLTSRLDESSDRERIPSEFLLRAASAARGRSAGLRDLAEGVIPGFRSVSLDNPAPRTGQVAVDRSEIRLRRVVSAPGSAHAALKALARVEPDLIRGPLAYDHARWEAGLTAFDGRIRDQELIRKTLEKVGPAAGPVSTSRLEAFAKCPYLFFLQRVMELEAWEEPEVPFELDPRDRGQAMHAILERFLQNCGHPQRCGHPLKRSGHPHSKKTPSNTLLAIKPDCHIQEN